MKNDKKYQWNKQVRLVPGESLFAIINAKESPAKMNKLPYKLKTLASKKLLVSDKLDFTISLPQLPQKKTFIEINQNIGVIQINCNGKTSSPLTAPPYRMEISDCIKLENSISLLVTLMPLVLDDPFDVEMPRKLDIELNLLVEE